jgi:hypothetical protein
MAAVLWGLAGFGCTALGLWALSLLLITKRDGWPKR